MRKIFISGLAALLVASSFSCRNSSVAPDTKIENSGIEPGNTPVVIKRYEKALFALDPENLKQEIATIYPDYALFLGTNWKDTMNLIRLRNYLTDKDIREIYNYSEQQYPNLDFLQSAINEAFTLLRKYYPGIKNPGVYTYVSGLDIENPVIFNDTVIILALDDFLGSEAFVYKKAGIPVYKTLRMNRANLVPACLAEVARSLVSADESKMTLLDLMLAEGKTLYLLDLLLPRTPDELKIGYTSSQLEWCHRNEASVWAYIVENRYLYSTDVQASVKFINDAPFTSGLVNESPGRLGTWTGWQIIKSYMKNNPEVTLQALLASTDAQTILAQSKYRPKK